MQGEDASLRANIPFDFHAGDKLLPAGQYLVQERGSVVILRVADSGKPAVILVTNGAIGADSSHKARMEFHRYGRAYFLSAIWNPFSEEGRQVPPTASEKEIAKNGTPAQAEVVVAGK
jgi:hypothetical protein